MSKDRGKQGRDKHPELPLDAPDQQPTGNRPEPMRVEAPAQAQLVRGHDNNPLGPAHWFVGKSGGIENAKRMLQLYEDVLTANAAQNRGEVVQLVLVTGAPLPH